MNRPGRPATLDQLRRRRADWQYELDHEGEWAGPAPNIIAALDLEIAEREKERTQ